MPELGCALKHYILKKKRLNLFTVLFQSCAQVLGGVFAMTLKSTIGWRGLFYLAGALNTIRKLSNTQTTKPLIKKCG